jgi:hypothetical protein
MKMVMGGETEYAVSALDKRGRVVDQGLLLDSLLEHAKRHLGYTSQSSRGRFLSNGGLLYLDAGLHIEWATPECTSPFEVVRYLKAGDRIVHDMATSYKNLAGHASDIFCSRTNVDYLSGTLWAAHESYMHEVPPDQLPEQLIPFLASRVIFGSGGWDYSSPGLRFTMSPRAHFITKTTDRDSQYTRPLFHTKNETLSRTGSHRLHVACSESLCSETANVLRFGTTALVLALIGRGVRPASGVTLASPIRALQRFAADLNWHACTAGVFPRWLSSLNIQRHYLELVEAHLGTHYLPDWAERVCGMWRTVLDDLETEPARVASTLDWAIKRRLFDRQLERRGISWASLRPWNAVLNRLKRRWVETRSAESFALRFVAESHPNLAAEKTRLTKVLNRHGLDWAQLADLDSARQEAFELDARFGELGERGVFNALEAAGALRHEVGGLDVERAMTEPPQDTRAKIRGTVVRRLSDAGTPYGAEWTSVLDSSTRRTLDLHDPFETEERWGAVRLDRNPYTDTLFGT